MEDVFEIFVMIQPIVVLVAVFSLIVSRPVDDWIMIWLILLFDLGKCPPQYRWSCQAQD